MNTLVFLIKVFPSNEIYPDEMLKDMPPYEVRAYTYKGNIDEASWAVANSMGCWAKALEVQTEQDFKNYFATITLKSGEPDFEEYLEEEGFV